LTILAIVAGNDIVAGRVHSRGTNLGKLGGAFLHRQPADSSAPEQSHAATTSSTETSTNSHVTHWQQASIARAQTRRIRPQRSIGIIDAQRGRGGLYVRVRGGDRVQSGEAQACRRSAGWCSAGRFPAPPSSGTTKVTATVTGATIMPPHPRHTAVRRAQRNRRAGCPISWRQRLVETPIRQDCTAGSGAAFHTE
jgi:hypothetical protein